MRSVDATAYLRPYPARRVRRPVQIRLTEDTYPLEPSPEQSWLPIAFRAFAAVARRVAVEDMLILGTGNGVDALGAAEILPRLRSLTATDLYAPCVDVARENVLANVLDGHGVAVAFHVGDLLGAVRPDQRFDLIYENLPNLPASSRLEVRRGTIGGRFFRAQGIDDVPERFAVHQLALHHRCLRDARAHVRPGGGVLTALGGRVSREIAFDLHRSCGYEPDLVAFDVKPQVEPGLVVPPYARAEEAHGVRFVYYAAEAVPLVARARAAGLDGPALADAVAGGLGRLAMSAREAEKRMRRGEAVAHSVLMVLGRMPSGR